MRLSRKWAALIVAAALLALPAVALARKHYPVKIFIDYSKADQQFHGTVTSHQARCRKGVKVVLVDITTSAVIGADTTDAGGHWQIASPPTADPANATVGRSGTSLESGVSFVCNRAVSQAIVAANAAG